MCLTAQILRDFQDLQATPPATFTVAWMEERAKTFAATHCGVENCHPAGSYLVCVAKEFAGARQALLELVRAVIRPAIRWLGTYIQQEGDDWVQGELDALGCILLGTLLAGSCGCWEYADRLSLDSETAHQRCLRQHALRSWNGQRPLREFLFEAMVFGCLQLTDPPRTSAQARTNGFRHGMLAKEVLDGELRAGRVLRCHQFGCAGEICEANDKCEVCRELSDIVDPAWWLWINGARVARPCWRCRQPGCNRLYFSYPELGPCPHPKCRCESRGNAPTTVWCRAEWHSIFDSPAGGTGPSSGCSRLHYRPTRHMEQPSWESRCRAWLATLAPDDRLLAEGLLLLNRRVEDIAKDLGLSRKKTHERARAVLSQLPEELRPILEEECE